MKYSPVQIRERRLLRLAQLIYDHWEEGSGMDTRYFEHPFIHDDHTLWGKSDGGGGHREHVVPRGFLRDLCMKMFTDGATIEAVQDVLVKNLWIVDISPVEAWRLDNEFKFKTIMHVADWRHGDDPFGRLRAAGITFQYLH